MIHRFERWRNRLPFAAELPLVGVLFCACAAMALIIMVTNGLERPSHDLYSTYNIEGDGYANLYAILDHEGFSVSRFAYDTTALTSYYGTYVLTSSDLYDSEDDDTYADRTLRHWVNAGGHAVFFVDELHAVPTAGHRQIHRAQAGPKRQTAACPEYIAPFLRAAGVSRLALRTHSRPLVAHCSESLYTDRNGVAAYEQRVGRGRITVILNAQAFDNDEIRRDDRARFAVALINRGDPGRIIFDEAVHGYGEERSLFDLLPQPVLLALCIAFFAWLLRLMAYAVPFGPRETIATASELTSRAFIDAAVAFFERAEAWDIAATKDAEVPRRKRSARDFWQRALLNQSEGKTANE